MFRFCSLSYLAEALDRTGHVTLQGQQLHLMSCMTLAFLSFHLHHMEASVGPDETSDHPFTHGLWRFFVEDRISLTEDAAMELGEAVKERLQEMGQRGTTFTDFLELQE